MLPCQKTSSSWTRISSRGIEQTPLVTWQHLARCCVGRAGEHQPLVRSWEAGWCLGPLSPALPLRRRQRCCSQHGRRGAASRLCARAGLGSATVRSSLSPSPERQVGSVWPAVSRGDTHRGAGLCVMGSELLLPHGSCGVNHLSAPVSLLGR